MQLNFLAQAFSDRAVKLLLRYLRRLIGNRKLKYELADIFGAILHVLRTGIQWRDLDHDTRFPPKSVVYYHFSNWSKNYVFDLLNQMFVAKLRHSRRVKQRNTKPRPQQPTACVIDSRSVKSHVWGKRECRGYDGNKKINGIKYHTATDTQGNVLATISAPANQHDSIWVPDLLDAIRAAGFTEVRYVFADAAYAGTQKYATLRGFTVEVVKRTDFVEAKELKAKGKSSAFIVMPKRWVIERTFAHLNWNRRLVVSYERLSATAEAFFLLGSVRFALTKF